jgi:hypothetical protein
MSYIGRQLNVPASTVQRTAEGAITAGKPCIVEADGDVAQVAETVVSEVIGSAALFESGEVVYVNAAYDANAERVVVVYQDRDNAEYGTAVVGTVSGTSISFGTPVVFESGGTHYTNVAYDANAQKVVIVFQDEVNSSYGTAIVGTVSGTSISFGSATVFESASTRYIGIAYDSGAQKVVIAYKDAGNSSYGTAIVGTVSGTSISFGTAVVFESAESEHISVAYDSDSQKVIIGYRDNGNSNYGTGIVGTVSGTSISFGSAVVFDAVTAIRNAVAYDANAQRVVIAYREASSTDQGMAVVGTVSGTSISFGTPAEFDAKGDFISAVYDATAQRVVIAYQDRADTYGKVVACTVSDTSITFTSPSTFESANTEYVANAYDSSAGKVVIAYRDLDNNDYGTSVVYQTPHTAKNLTSENFIGFAENDCTDNGLATIQLGGSVNDKQTSLTAGQTYFVQTDGTISTTAGSPSVTAGTAVSSTEILVKG